MVLQVRVGVLLVRLEDALLVLRQAVGDRRVPARVDLRERVGDRVALGLRRPDLGGRVLAEQPLALLANRGAALALTEAPQPRLVLLEPRLVVEAVLEVRRELRVALGERGAHRGEQLGLPARRVPGLEVAHELLEHLHLDVAAGELRPVLPAQVRHQLGEVRRQRRRPAPRRGRPRTGRAAGSRGHRARRRGRHRRAPGRPQPHDQEHGDRGGPERRQRAELPPADPPAHRRAAPRLSRARRCS
jgi:hypothetical protein